MGSCHGIWWEQKCYPERTILFYLEKTFKSEAEQRGQKECLYNPHSVSEPQTTITYFLLLACHNNTLFKEFKTSKAAVGYTDSLLSFPYDMCKMVCLIDISWETIIYLKYFVIYRYVHVSHGKYFCSVWLIYYLQKDTADATNPNVIDHSCANFFQNWSNICKKFLQAWEHLEDFAETTTFSTKMLPFSRSPFHSIFSQSTALIWALFFSCFTSQPSPTLKKLLNTYLSLTSMESKHYITAKY